MSRDSSSRWWRAGRRALAVRVLLLSGMVLAGAVSVLLRAYEIQVEHPEQYERHYREEIDVRAKRGNIYDRHGAELAVSVELDSFYADPVLLKRAGVDAAQFAAHLQRILGVDQARMYKRLSSNKRFVWVKRRATPKQSAAVWELVEQLGIRRDGFGSRKEPRRYYPNVATAAHVLGFTDGQGRGVEGLERRFETHLRGAVDRVAAVLDARGDVVFSEELIDREAAQGHDLTLTLDRTLQVVAERELELGVRTSEARAGSIVVLDPRTGELLALANYPSFNPNEPGAATPGARRNRAVTDRFEPGSTVKPFTVAGALAAGVIGPNQQIDCEEGAMEVAEYVIHDSHKWESLTPAQVLAFSSNIGTAKIGAALGRPGLFRVFRRFGFGKRTGVTLPAETSGILRHYRRWYDMDAATISFGQGMSTTALQLAMGIGALANGGRLMRPLLVKRISDAQGAVVEAFAPAVRRQVVPSHVARLTADMLTAVTGPGGTGEAAAVDGYLVAGKTGTAQKADYVHGGYAKDRWMASFVGFVPADKPRVVIAVTIDEPVIEHYGGTVAGPVFRRVADRALRHLGVPASHGGGALAKFAKDQQERQERQQEAREAADKKALASNGAPVDDANPEGAPAEPQPLEEGRVRVPDVAGKSARGALVALKKGGLVGIVSGSGLAVQQSPAADAEVAKGAEVHVVLRPPVFVDDEEQEEPEAEPDGRLAASSVEASP